MRSSKLLFAAGLTLATLVLPWADARGSSCGPDAIQRQTPHTCGIGNSCTAAEDDLVAQVSHELTCVGLCDYYVVPSDLECTLDGGEYILCGYVEYWCDLQEYCEIFPERC